MDVTINRPDAPNHYMVLKPVKRKIVLRRPDGELLAESVNATRLLESGRTLYDPVLYVPRQDVVVSLEKTDRSTFCPLKGDASYFSVGDEIDAAWSYEEPLPFSGAIKGLVAFYADRIIVEEHPLP